MTRIQEVQYDLLRRLTRLLDQNGIDYWLAYGTSLGAVRHDGFIPWDDDVDIYINGNQYERLKSAFANEIIDGMRLDDSSNNNYPFTFPKIVDVTTKLVEKRFEHLDYVGGIYIDVFPLYTVHDNRIFRYVGYFKRYIDYAIVEAHFGQNQDSLVRKTIAWILNIFSAERAQKRLYKRYKKGFCLSTSNKFLSEPLQFNDKCIHYMAHFNGYVMHQFEGLTFRIPLLYDEYLKTQYGDYMQFPPVENRKSCHNFVYVEYSDGTIESGDENE